MGNTVLITGAGSGLGRALCQFLSRSADRVLITDLDLDAAEETLDLLHNDRLTTCQGSAFRLDVTDDRQVIEFFEAVDGSVDVLINNAGLQHVAALEEFDLPTWQQLIDVMRAGAARMTRAVLPGMRSGRFGRIINIGSIHSLVASPYKSAYVAAKHGLLGLAKTVALETADVDITVNTICPSYIRTPLVDKQISQQAEAHGMNEDEVIEKIMLEPMPKRAFITTEEIGAAIEFLVSHEARNITGQTITIDGGWTLK